MEILSVAGRFAEFFIFGLAPLMVAAFLLPGQSFAEEKMIAGEVLYRERIALPPNAKLTVQLADVSLADAPAAIIAEQTLDPAGQVPIKFELRFDPSVIQPKMSYALLAHITVDDQLWFITDTRHEVDPLAASAQTVLVKRVAQGEPDGSSSLGIFGVDWIVAAIDGKDAVGQTKPTFRIEADGKVNGRGGCNGYGGAATLKDGQKITFGDMHATLMACEQSVMDQEMRFFAALKEVETFRIEDGKLVLAGKNGEELMRLAVGQ
jgi:putative lipoprotein